MMISYIVRPIILLLLSVFNLSVIYLIASRIRRKDSRYRHGFYVFFVAVSLVDFVLNISTFVLVFVPSILGSFTTIPCRAYLVIHYCALVQPLLHAAIAVNRYQYFRAEPKQFVQNALSTRILVSSVTCVMTPPLVVIAFYATRPCGYSIEGVHAINREDKMVQGLVGSTIYVVSATVGFGCSAGTVLRLQRLRRAGRLKGVAQDADFTRW
ncbi:hypothetical protein AAVH_13011 [Aphelenchoides avenae]|nr:hypothetical protein AAVH_13011 [Aphelenchus avenae]